MTYKLYLGNNNNNNFDAIGSNKAWMMLGLGGDDKLKGGNKADIIDGGDGNDELRGHDGNDELLGGLGNDNLEGGANNDKLEGGDGHDFLDGQAGDDTMIGGLGNDFMIVDSLGDRVVERPGEGIDFVQTSLSNYTLERGNEVEVLIFFDTAGAAVGTGNEFDNSIVGNAYNNTLSGQEGNDRLSGFAGDDFLIGGIGNDSLYGGVGNDYLGGGEGTDSLYGGIGNDLYAVNNVGDVVVENVAEGDYDRVNAFVSYSLENSENVEELFLVDANTAINGTGNNGNNFIVGNSANNTLRGLKGSDTLLGEGGDDILVGTTGEANLSEVDTLDGGAGSDVFVLGEANRSYYYAGEGYAVIADFNNIQEGDQMESDRIQLKGNFSNYNLELEMRVGVGTEEDTVIYRDGNIIGIIQDRTITGDITTDKGFVRV